MPAAGHVPFEELVRRNTGAAWVRRQWLSTAVDQALTAPPTTTPSTRLVLITGEPGAGKTGMLAGLADAHPDWLRYFIGAVDNGGREPGDIASFLLSVGHQLAHQRPELFDVERLSVVVAQHFGDVRPGASATGIRIKDLTVSPFHRTATLVVQQSADSLGGTALGVDIGTAHLEPRLLTPDNLAQLALIGPARVLLGQDPAARIVILLDALDEAAASGEAGSLLHWLATDAALPANVSIVMSSRPHSALGRLRSSRGAQLVEIDLDPGTRHVREDLLAFAGKVLGTAEVNATVEAKGLLPDQFQRRVATRASGNFLYLASYARALTDALADADDAVIGRLFDLDSLPPRLAGIYGLFVETAREQIEAFGSIRLDDAPPGRGTTAYAWETVGQPLLGVLTVAQEPLTEKQLAELSAVPVRRRHIRNIIARLRWLLDLRDGRIALYHSSVGEFLRSDLARERHEDCWVDETEWHEQIVSHYRGSAASWPQVDWSSVDRYGLAHLAHHVLKAGSRVSADAAELPCAGLLHAIRTEFGAERRFLDLVDRIAHHVAGHGLSGVGLPALMYLGVVRHQAARPSAASPPLLGLLARLGRRKEAVERATSIPPSIQRFAAIGEILRYPGPEDGGPSRADLLELLVESALTIPLDRSALVHARSAVETAAELLAPRDLDRALRLWQHGQQLGGSPSPREPDALYRAAATAEQNPYRAAALITKMAGEQWKDLLDLAQRAGHQYAADLLRRAEAALQESEPAALLLGFARLSVQWTHCDAAVGECFRTRIRAQAHEVRADERASWALLEAARLLADPDRSTARDLLAPLDTMKANGFSGGALLGAARLWNSWGEPERAAALADRYLAVFHDPWSRFEARSAAGRLSDADARSTIEEILARIPGPPSDPDAHPMAVSDRDTELATVVRRMAQYDLGRAFQIAGRIYRTNWMPSWMPRYAAAPNPLRDIQGEDRNSVLAALAHIHLDRGETTEARAILDELLVTEHAPLVGGGVFSYLHSSSPKPSATAEGNGRDDDLFGEMALHNLHNDWSARVRRRFFQDPADVVRAVELGGHGSLDTVVRRFAERLAENDRPHSLALVRSIATPEERAIGLATLHVAAHSTAAADSRHGAEAEGYSSELDDTLTKVPRRRWTIDDGPDGEALAYLRPDHRLRFELAARAKYTCRDDLDAIRDLPYLYHAALSSFLASVSADYAEAQVRSAPVHPSFEEVHRRNLRMSQEFHASGLLIDITQAIAAFHEYRASRKTPGRPSRASEVKFANPLYAAVVDLMTSDPGPGSAFEQRVRRLWEQGTPSPAVAGLLVFAAEARPEHRNELLSLARQLVLAADSGTLAGQETLAMLAASPLLGPLVEPAALFRTAASPMDTKADLFAVALARDPAVAMSMFYEVLSHSWRDAMTLLERVADKLPDLLDPSAMAALGSAIGRGLGVTSPAAGLPDVIDGVYLAELIESG
ncbi:hypothetical protein [Streptomyces huasconensis]|uniref:hypothetical protein n=1 Tax=Streptomyces huasconensis TaxID=1854574 RepID=UPI0036F52FF6